MTRCKIFTALAFASGLFLLLSDVHLQTAVTQNAPEEEVEDQEPTCSLDPSPTSTDCSTGIATVSASNSIPPKNSHGGITKNINQQDLTRRVISLTDETFDDITWTSSPGTWLILFNTGTCALC